MCGAYRKIVRGIVLIRKLIEKANRAEKESNREDKRDREKGRARRERERERERRSKEIEG